MKYIRYAFPVILVILLISPHYMFSVAKTEMVEVRITFPGLPFGDVELKIEKAEAEEMVQEMERMAEKGNLASIFSFLRGYANFGNFDFSLSDSNVTNYLSFVFGFADGLFAYTSDILFFLLIYALTNDAILTLVLTALFVAFSHLIPFRLVVPAGIIEVEEGSIKTVGINGMQEIENESFLVGFVGIIVSIFIPSASITFLPLFIAGYSIAVLPNPFG